MTERLPKANLTAPDQPATLVLACDEEHGHPAAWDALPGAAILRTPGGRFPTDGLRLSELLQPESREFAHLVLVGHSGCKARPTRAEPAANTAVISAWRGYAPAAHALARDFRRGWLSAEGFDARLDVLVQLANLEACPVLHRALRDRQLRATGIVYDEPTARTQLFDGYKFRDVDTTDLREIFPAGQIGVAAAEPWQCAGTSPAWVPAPADHVGRSLA